MSDNEVEYRCIHCFTFLGEQNPRQYCGKSRCYYDYYDEKNEEDLKDLQEIRESNLKIK